MYLNWFFSEIPPTYDEAIKIKSVDIGTSPQSSSIPIHSISLSIDQATNSTTIPNRKQSTSQ